MMAFTFLKTVLLLLAKFREQFSPKTEGNDVRIEGANSSDVAKQAISKPKPRVLLVTPWDRQGGLATYSRYLVEKLEERCSVTVFPWDNELLIVRGFGILLIGREFIRRLRRSDVLHIQYTFGRYLLSAPLILLLCKIVGTKTVMTQHERFDNLPVSGALFAYHQALYFLVDVLIVHTDNRKSKIWRYHHERTSVVPHGVINREIAKTPTNNAKTILLPGLIRPIKGHDVAIRALTELEDYRLRILGGIDNEEYVDYIRELAIDLGVDDRIDWQTTFVPEDEMFQELRSASLVILPYEPHTSMSGILSHCISWQVPTLVTDCPSFRSVIDSDEVFLSGRDPSSVAESIRNVTTSELMQKAIINEFDTLSERYSWNNVAELTYNLYSTND